MESSIRLSVLSKGWTEVLVTSIVNNRKSRKLYAYLVDNPGTRLFRPPSGLMANRIVQMLCPVSGCFNLTRTNAVYRVGSHICGVHRASWFGRHRIPTSLEKHTDNIVTAKKRKCGGAVQFYATCSNAGCARPANVRFGKAVKGNTFKYKCTVCSRKYIVAGRATSSRRLYERRKSIVGWRPAKNSTGHDIYLPLTTCAFSGCTTRVLFYNRVVASRQHWPGYCKKCFGKWNRKKPYGTAYKQLKKGAIKRRIAFHLTYEQYLLIFTVHGQNCFYCKEPLARNAHAVSTGGVRLVASGGRVDRLINSVGYNFENCVPCCATCNHTKSNKLSWREMKLVAAARKGRFDQAIDLLRLLQEEPHRLESGGAISC